MTKSTRTNVTATPDTKTVTTNKPAVPEVLTGDVLVAARTAYVSGRTAIVAGSTFLYALASNPNVGRGKVGVTVTSDDKAKPVHLVTLTDGSRFVGLTDDTGKRYARVGAIMARHSAFGPDHAAFGNILRNVTAAEVSALFTGPDLTAKVTLPAVVKAAKAAQDRIDSGKGSKSKTPATPATPGKGDENKGENKGGGSDRTPDPEMPRTAVGRIDLAAKALSTLRAEDMTPATAEAFLSLVAQVERLQGVTVARSPKSATRVRAIPTAPKSKTA